MIQMAQSGLLGSDPISCEVGISGQSRRQEPCVPFLPDTIHYSCETQFTRKVDETFAMPSDSGPSNPFIQAFCHSWNVASVTNIPP